MTLLQIASCTSSGRPCRGTKLTTVGVITLGTANFFTPRLVSTLSDLSEASSVRALGLKREKSQNSLHNNTLPKCLSALRNHRSLQVNLVARTPITVVIEHVACDVNLAQALNLQ